MEIMTINELDFYQDNMRNSIIMIFKGIGNGWDVWQCQDMLHLKWIGQKYYSNR